MTHHLTTYNLQLSLWILIAFLLMVFISWFSSHGFHLTKSYTFTLQVWAKTRGYIGLLREDQPSVKRLVDLQLPLPVANFEKAASFQF
ncbi:hypothetical protein B0T17DRAFT_137500 [Bombardia bombarda]|uniref:Uncharacterized protein n=1 Tax=Bombardia bombarda TaxID=252184 RepID=A0AA39T0G9_9PEZI|nr:hypothetical protein B0T17DRAFT_137500 [Bombardia bombarda]